MVDIGDVRVLILLLAFIMEELKGICISLIVRYWKELLTLGRING